MTNYSGVRREGYGIDPIQYEYLINILFYSDTVVKDSGHGRIIVPPLRMGGETLTTDAF
jgi:hypothetical protein